MQLPFSNFSDSKSCVFDHSHVNLRDISITILLLLLLLHSNPSSMQDVCPMNLV